MSIQDTPNTIYLKDYTQPEYWIDSVNLRFEIGDETRVVAEMEFRRNTSIEGHRVLELYGEQLRLGTIMLNEHALANGQFSVDEGKLFIPDVPDQFTLQIETFIHPATNTSLEGLYKSSGNFCTQCEAEGFRKITYYLDRPDVMARFSTTIVADKKSCPVLLSNGNLVDAGDMDHGRHYAVWEDPFKKPSYLFALVAGNLQCVEGQFVTRSGRKVALKIYVEAHNLDKCDHAMQSLQKAMAWDEQKYGREYDLDIYMIVAVDDFNMGAMENKGLNVFNSKFVLAKPETATDADFINIEGVIGHEYFHNWSGNRVTCRDWFQLTLKEGLTVFRDQQFTADMNSAAVKRIDDVNILRTRQYTEDAGPMSHPIQPDSYVEINNFYTVTVYNKGAEVIRMMHTLLGEDLFRKGMDYYFETYDGQAVTTEDFVLSMEHASGRDLTQFRRWYHQAATPELTVSGEYDAIRQSYIFNIRQSPVRENNRVFHIPVAVGLIAKTGEEISHAARILEVTKAEQKFEIENITTPVVPSVLRNFSAPVKLKLQLPDSDLGYLMAHDTDDFNRWNAAQQLGVNMLLHMIEAYKKGHPETVAKNYLAAFGDVLSAPNTDLALVARVLTLPDEDYLAELMPYVDVDAIHIVRESACREIAEKFQPLLKKLFVENQEANYKFDFESIGKRSIKAMCLAYLSRLNTADTRKLAVDQYYAAHNMTDQMAAMRSLVHIECDEKAEILQHFYTKWQNDPLVIDKWFIVQATASLSSTLHQVEKLLKHEAFDITVPNRVRSLIGAFSQANPVCFHESTGRGYRILADVVMKLNVINPQIAARLVSPLIQWKRFDASRQRLMKAQLEHIAAIPDLSRDVYEIVHSGLAQV